MKSKKKNILFYLPNGIMIPEVHLMTSLIQNYLDDNKNKVTVLTCAGTKDFSCSLNIYSIGEICKACISRRKIALSKLKGNVKILEIKNLYKFPKNFHKNKVKELMYQNIDFGLGAYSSYVNTSKDSYLKGNISNEVIKNLLNTSYSYFQFFKHYLKHNRVDELLLYNSRMSEKRIIFRYAINKKIHISNYEKLSTARFFNFGKNFSQDRKFINKEILKFQKNITKDFRNEKNFFNNKFFSKKDPITSKIYSQTKSPYELPKKWDLSKKNIVFFTSSDDEHLSFGKEFVPPFATNQEELIKKTCEILRYKPNFVLWIRIHPAIKNSKWFNKDFYENLKKKFKNVEIIYSDEYISSYAIMKRAFNIVCFWSFLLLESSYWRKQKPISLTKNDFTEYGVAIVPNSLREYQKLIFLNPKIDNNLKKKALVYVKFFLKGGLKIKYFSGSVEVGYKFKNFNLDLNLFDKVFYYFGKIKEKLINNYYN